MGNENIQRAWRTYCEAERALLEPILEHHGYTLDQEQPHVKGERFLQQAVTTSSGRKLILLGKNAQGVHVVIKATREQGGINELTHERTCRDILKQIDFAAEIFHTPEEMDFLKEKGFVMAVQRFIDQECPFLERPLSEQFTLALSAFKGQEGAHATTSKHRRLVANTFGFRDAKTYFSNFEMFRAKIEETLREDKQLHALLKEAQEVLVRNSEIIEQYGGFLTHTDFVPHNIRIQDGKIYLLDHSSLTFGNKYEGWARFINFMTLYNPKLQQLLTEYVKNNRTEEERISLWLMRIYRLGEIVLYYSQTLAASSDNLLLLNVHRIEFWSTVLSHVLKQEEVPEDVIKKYTKSRDDLRSEDEKERQKGLH